jgi:hypothetical protein
LETHESNLKANLKQIEGPSFSFLFPAVSRLNALIACLLLYEDYVWVSLQVGSVIKAKQCEAKIDCCLPLQVSIALILQASISM